MSVRKMERQARRERKKIQAQLREVYSLIERLEGAESLKGFRSGLWDLARVSGIAVLAWVSIWVVASLAQWAVGTRFVLYLLAL